MTNIKSMENPRNTFIKPHILDPNYLNNKIFCTEYGRLNFGELYKTEDDISHKESNKSSCKHPNLFQKMKNHKRTSKVDKHDQEFKKFEHLK